MFGRGSFALACLVLTACHTPTPLEGDAEHVTVSLLDDAESVAAVYCRMFGKFEQFRNMDTVHQTAMFDCVTMR